MFGVSTQYDLQIYKSGVLLLFVIFIIFIFLLGLSIFIFFCSSFIADNLWFLVSIFYGSSISLMISSILMLR